MQSNWSTLEHIGDAAVPMMALLQATCPCPGHQPIAACHMHPPMQPLGQEHSALAHRTSPEPAANLHSHALHSTVWLAGMAPTLNSSEQKGVLPSTLPEEPPMAVDETVEASEVLALLLPPSACQAGTRLPCDTSREVHASVGPVIKRGCCCCKGAAAGKGACKQVHSEICSRSWQCRQGTVISKARPAAADKARPAATAAAGPGTHR